MTSILIVDDEPKMSGVLARMLAREGYEVDWTDSPAQALEKLAERGYDILLSDLRMPEMTGIDLLERAKKVNPATDFIMMTAYATPQTAVEAMKLGAIDYLIKPFAVEELKALIKRVEQTRLAPAAPDADGDREPVTTPAPAPAAAAGSAGPGPRPASPSAPSPAPPASAPDGASPLDRIIAASPQMRELIARAKKVAASNASVLLRGESGTGKEVLARAIHASSPRAAGPLVVVNCGAIPENLMESELFGHVKGAFTGAVESRRGMFEAAHGGTIFLDEIGELPPHLQVKLLRVLQEGEVQRVGEAVPHKVDVRVIAATNRNLEEAIRTGGFRQDLYYRLNVIPIHLPPLRERREDLQPLIEHFLARYSPPGEAGKTLSPEAAALLARYDYPGNIRELENAIEHAVVLSDGPVIQPADLPFQIQNYDWATGAGGPPASLGVSPGALAGMHLEEIEKRCILAALEKARYNHTRAAAHLGITRRTLGYRIQKYGLEGVVEEGVRRVRESRQNAG